MDSITRKCNLCKKDIDITDGNEDFFCTVSGVKTKVTKYMHSECYIKYATNLKRNKKTIDECNDYIKKCKTENIEYERKDKEKIREYKKRCALYDYLFDFYGISFFPKSFYTRMDSVFKGEYKGLNREISPTDLLEMWQQKKSYLQAVAEKNSKTGNEISGMSHIYYDLAILLSKYDSYLKWKEKQKNALVDKEKREEDSKEFISFNRVVKNQKDIHSKNSSGININSILDEI